MQETAVGEGLALGCLSLGVVAVTSERPTVELAMAHAWRSWPAARTFPAINMAVGQATVYRVLRMSERRRGPILAWWSSDGPYEPVIAETWTVHDAAEILESSTGVGLVAWVNLAQRFIDRLGEGRVGYVL